MKKYILYTILLLLPLISFQQNSFHHELIVKITPDSSYLKVTDKITVPESKDFIFSLNSNLKITFTSKEIKLIEQKKEQTAEDVGMDRNEDKSEIKVVKYKLHPKNKNTVFTIKYEGKLSSKLKHSFTNYQRGFSESSGIISSKGIYLAGSTYWSPTSEKFFATFDLTTILPEGWKTVSQGKRVDDTTINGEHFDRWVCKSPQEEIFLIAATFTEYGFVMNNGVKAIAFLRTPDESLANKYLNVTEQYMDMYQEMIGPYPYLKFALVENFWETGYGMPSFTLLGEKIIRFPFILHSSYPHELLHNWWGNSVYVDFNNGNWCEGITAYMADELIKEQQGQGYLYRRSTLKKYTDYVTPENDFPLTQFISRHDAPSEAIGYGKALMVWHMLRQRFGDDIFIKGWQKLYKDFKFKTASFDDICKIMETVSGDSLQQFFNQWINNTGAPEINILKFDTNQFNKQYRIFLTLEQIQPGEPFNIDIPVAIATKTAIREFNVNMSKKKESYQFFINEKPLKLSVDPQYDVFRIVNPKEVPPALSTIWSSKQNVFILPSATDKFKKELYLTFVTEWKKYDTDEFKIIYDNQIESLPQKSTPWIIGFENKFVDSINRIIKSFDSQIYSDSVKLNNRLIDKSDNSFIITVFNPDDATKNYIFIEPGNMEAVTGLVRKLPHYGKYSYLVFEGNEPQNTVKGEWAIKDSPLIRYMAPGPENISCITKREALAYLKPVFSEQRMMQTIKYLASDMTQGRGLGTPYLDSAAAYIAYKFKEYEIKPLSENYFQTFKHHFTDKPTEPKDITLRNVTAIIPGTDSILRQEPVIVSAHYDHLGLGWPDVHSGDKGKIHYGADDNASGVAILLEMAKNMADIKPKRSIVFVALTAEEAGLIGSNYFVNHAGDYFKGPIYADINLDTDGSLFDKKILVLNGNTAKEWKFIFMGTDYTTGIKSEVLNADLDASDQVSFIETGIPAVQLFTGATENYHRPSDTWDKIDSKGLVKVATVAKEVVEYLANRTEPLPFTGDKKTHKTSINKNHTEKSKRASTGTIPDFVYAGPGVKINSLIKNSNGEKAGLKNGDIILKVNDDNISDLKNYTSTLDKYKPGDTAEFTILRNGKTIEIKLTFGER
jgi:hypothetical protein